MNRKYLMIATAVVTGIIGLAATFFPKEILSHFTIAANEIPVIFIQITGALYLGFAIMNWMAKTVLIGGIYARPLAMGNFVHFMIAALALVKVALKVSSFHLWLAAILYSI